MILAQVSPIETAYAAVPPDYDLPNGHFFSQANGAPPGTDLMGFAVMNEGGVPFWDEFRRLGSLPSLGYPISRRFQWDGFTVQAFQKGVLQWRPEVGRALLVNTFDLLHANGKDAWLQSLRSTPPPLPVDFDAGKPGDAVVRDRLALLDANPAIKSRYLSTPDALNVYGLPVSRVVDNGNHFVVRFQRTVMQQWKVDVPWARAGQVTIANGGDIAKEAGLLPPEAVATEIPPLGGGRVVAIDPGHGGSEIGAVYRFADGTTILEKDLNLRVALKVGDLLTRAGYKPVLTRTTDNRVNNPPKSVTGRLPIGLDDDLQARIDIANNAGAQLFLSIHFNGHTDRGLSGSEVYYCESRPFAAESKRFAGVILANLKLALASIGNADLKAAVKRDSQAVGQGRHFYLLGPAGDPIVRPSKMPAALAEGLFVTNPADAAALRTGRSLDVIANAYATAVHQYFIDASTAQLPVLKPAPSSTPAPSPAPQPRPKPQPTAVALGQGTVTLDSDRGAFLRAAPTTSSSVVRSLPNREKIEILQVVDGEAVVAGSPRWYKARYDGSEGFIYGQLVTTTVIGKGIVSANGGALLRASTSTSAKVITPVPDGATIDLLEAKDGEAVVSGNKVWYRARYGSGEGYVYSTLVKHY